MIFHQQIFCRFADQIYKKHHNDDDDTANDSTYDVRRIEQLCWLTHGAVMHQMLAAEF